MLANRLLVLGVALGMVVGCSHDDRANAASKDEGYVPATAPVAAAAPKRAASVKKTTTKKTTTTHSATKAKSTAAKPATRTSGGSSALLLNVPSGQLPPTGQCRIWKAGASAGQQPQSRSCDGIAATAPAGSMILDRAAKETKVVRVRYVDSKQAGHVVKVRVFTVPSGKYLWDEKV